jgi:MOSC domain-containing protein YiiM
MELSFTEVRVGRPRHLGTTRRGPVTSGIAKEPVTGASLRLGVTNLAGDAQADLASHGGPDKAVHVYPAEHRRRWSADGVELGPGGTGENLASVGGDERDVRIGSVWSWGDAVVQICQPRAPCFKLGLHTGHRDLPARVIETGRCGWYLRVLRPGVVPTSGVLRLEDEPADAPTVADAFDALFRSTGPDHLARVLTSAALADAWRTMIGARHDEPT